MALGLLRDGRRSTDLLADLQRWFDTLRAIADAPGGVAALEILLNYAQEVGDIPLPPLQKFAHQLGPAAVEALMTTAERLRQQGREEVMAEVMTTAERIRQQVRDEMNAEATKARAEGEAHGKSALIARQLTLRFGPLPADVAARLQAASSVELETWAERLLTASRLADVFE